MILAVVGMDWVTRVQMGLLVLLIVSQFDFIIGSFMPKESEKKFGFTGYSVDTFKKNLYSDYHDNSENPKEINFFTLFGVFFPAVTGIVAGANLSGDLKDPGTGNWHILHDIPSREVKYNIHEFFQLFQRVRYLPSLRLL